ncbi:MAG: hypothetical protein M1538_00725 [Candidatus Marsarchaeota archaeon]|jgi:hypothetical protein|nr:hypothetical protein [Candidatus Marsarchaeota archaeon]
MENEIKKVDVDVDLNPSKIKPFTKSEIMLNIKLKNNTLQDLYWGECDIVVASPLSLANDIELNTGRLRVGIIKSSSEMSKQAKLYTRPNNYPDEYKFKIIAYFYDVDGAIAERVEKNISIMCIEEKNSISANNV